MQHTTRSDEELVNLALLKVDMIRSGEFADADEAWESLFHAVGHEPNFEVADRAFADATAPGSYIDPQGHSRRV